MAVPTDLFKTYETIGLREDLADLIKIVSPVDTLYYSSLAEGGANATKVEWQVDSLAASGANAALEGDDESISPVTPTTRVFNYTQIQKKLFGISNTNASASVKRAGRVSEKDYQTSKKSKELAKDVEYAFLRGLANAGAAGTARQMRGIMNWLTTNVSKAADATLNSSTGEITGGTNRAFTEDLLATLLQNIFVNGGNPSILYTTPALKAKISAWSQATSNYRINLEKGKVGNSVDIYVSDFGDINVKPHREMPSGTAIVLDPAHKGKKATLRNTHREQLAITGDNQKYVIRVEHTLRDVAEAACGRLVNLQ